MATSQATKAVFRSAGASFRSLIHRQLRPTVNIHVPVANNENGKPANDCSWQRRLVIGLSPQTFDSHNPTGLLAVEEEAVAIVRRKLEAARKKIEENEDFNESDLDEIETFDDDDVDEDDREYGFEDDDDDEDASDDDDEVRR